MKKMNKDMIISIALIVSLSTAIFIGVYSGNKRKVLLKKDGIECKAVVVDRKWIRRKPAIKYIFFVKGKKFEAWESVSNRIDVDIGDSVSIVYYKDDPDVCRMKIHIEN